MEETQFRPVNTLLIDNYDSYTYNLYQYLAAVNGAPPQVVYNDQYSWEELLQYIEGQRFDNIVISPGPGTPDKGKDIGVCLQLIRHDLGLPILGVCLGMQAIGLAYGALVRPAPEPVHGRLSQITHRGHKLFSGIPSGAEYEAVRYHSLVVVKGSLPAELEGIAWASASSHHAPNLPSHGRDPGDQGEALLMGLAHVTRPVFGVQYHPESVATQHGKRLLANFRDITLALRPASPSPPLVDYGAGANGAPGSAGASGRDPLLLELRWECLPALLPRVGGSERLFLDLFTSHASRDLYWLDSVSKERCRFSYMGGRGGPLWKRLRFRLPQGGPAGASPSPGTLEIEHADGASAVHETFFWNFLKESIQEYRFVEDEAREQLPFNFWGGYVGYLGYELKAECGSPNRHRSPHPDACLFLSDRFVAVDHAHGDIYVLALSPHGDCAALAASKAWIASTCASVTALSSTIVWGVPGGGRPRVSGGDLVCNGVAAPAPAAEDGASVSRGARHPRCPSWQPACAGNPNHGPTQIKRMTRKNGAAVFQDDASHAAPCPPATEPQPPGSAGLASGKLAVCRNPLSGRPETPGLPLGTSLERAQDQPHANGGFGAATGAFGDNVVRPDGGSKGENHVGCSFNGAGVLPEGNSGSADANSERRHDQAHVNGGFVGPIAACEDVNGRDRSMQENHVGCPSSSAEVLPVESSSSAKAEHRLAVMAAAVGPSGACEACCEGDMASGRPASEAQQSRGGTGRSLGEARSAFKLRTSHRQYLENVKACLGYLHAGESYELCLTTTMVRKGAPDALQLYRQLRRTNPAPYSAFLSFGGGGPQICCSSPERFLRGGRGGELEAAPIKGTARRDADPEGDRALAAALAASEKDRAENLMIVDLLRNDLGRVCQVGSVQVTSLMEVETYATVHQLVSRVVGQREASVSAVDCIRAAFPGGSMTGAPKLRSIELLDRLEPAARGVYSGSIGYLSFNGAFDFNIVIRTAVIQDDEISIGAGGAVVVQSEPDKEYEEMRLKAAALLRAVGLCDGQEGSARVDDSDTAQILVVAG